MIHLPIFMEVECDINEMIVVVFHYMISVCVKHYFLLSALFHQIDYANGFVYFQFLVKMLSKGDLGFSFILVEEAKKKY